jgi:hypothetical protein
MPEKGQNLTCPLPVKRVRRSARAERRGVTDCLARVAIGHAAPGSTTNSRFVKTLFYCRET